MPVKKRTMKRKLKTSIDKPQTPTKIRRRDVSEVQEEVFVVQRRHERGPGVVLTLGQGDVGQLGLGPDVMEKSRPALVPDMSNIVDVCAGGMHTLCLTDHGEVFSFGCNDEGALGRPTTVEGSETKPGKVTLDGKAVLLSAGDSHSAALLEDGRVFAWGAFRLTFQMTCLQILNTLLDMLTEDSHGPMGLTSDGIIREPFHMKLNDKVVKIVSGTDHLLMLTKQGQLYSCGCGEQGQLGRLSERVATRECRQGMNQLLIPAQVTFGKMSKHGFDQIWAGSSCTFVQEAQTGKVYVCGLNNYKQMGLDDLKSHFYPALCKPFTEKSWIKICGGQHHTLALDTNGLVYALGRKEYGRLGLGEDSPDVDRPTLVPLLKDKKCVDISCGTCVSYAVTDNGEVYAWGMGTNGQLGTGDEDDQYEPVKVGGKQLEGRAVVAVSGGGQHAVFLAKPLPSSQQS